MKYAAADFMNWTGFTGFLADDRGLEDKKVRR
jgi:hypothetical protein